MLRHREKIKSDFFHNLYIVFPLLFPHQEGFFVIFAENFRAMQLSEQQKTILRVSPIGLMGMLGVPLFNALIGRQTWMDTLWDSLTSVGIWAALVGLFLLGARMPKKKDENQ